MLNIHHTGHEEHKGALDAFARTLQLVWHVFFQDIEPITAKSLSHPPLAYVYACFRHPSSDAQLLALRRIARPTQP